VHLSTEYYRNRIEVGQHEVRDRNGVVQHDEGPLQRVQLDMAGIVLTLVDVEFFAKDGEPPSLEHS
jgi:hypothetical protein